MGWIMTFDVFALCTAGIGPVLSRTSAAGSRSRRCGVLPHELAGQLCGQLLCHGLQIANDHASESCIAVAHITYCNIKYAVASLQTLSCPSPLSEHAVCERCMQSLRPESMMP